MWDALTRDRRFAGRGFKRQVPIGPHITDFVSFASRLVLDIVPVDESQTAARAREDKRGWLAERGYRVLAIPEESLRDDLATALDRVAQAVNDAA